jgi:UDP-N-acetylglucosamine 2-epimerase (non-hydrolysing)
MLAKQNLLNEGKNPASIFVTGNTAIDALKTTVKTDYTHPILSWAENSRLILMTAHRRENIGEPLERIFKAIKRVVLKTPDIKIVYPVHLNPVIRQSADKIFGDCERIKIIEPLDVLDFHNFMSRA